MEAKHAMATAQPAIVFMNGFHIEAPKWFRLFRDILLQNRVLPRGLTGFAAMRFPNRGSISIYGRPALDWLSPRSRSAPRAKHVAGRDISMPAPGHPWRETASAAQSSSNRSL